MADSNPIRIIGEGTLADIIVGEIINYRPQSVALGLSADALRNEHGYFRKYALHLQADEIDRILSGRMRTTKSISVDEIFRNLGSMLPQNYEMTDSVQIGSSKDDMACRNIVLKSDSAILREDVVVNEEAAIRQMPE